MQKRNFEKIKQKNSRKLEIKIKDKNDFMVDAFVEMVDLITDQDCSKQLSIYMIDIAH